jgi:pimeloyl-ACP methyl ester carboxylesterase
LNRYRATLIAAWLMGLMLLPQPAAAQESACTINGQKFHVQIFGAPAPTVVFEAGLGNDATTWRLVAGPIAKFARVVTYDRAGLGQSLPMIDKTAVTADKVATNLYALLAAADIRPSYILVGHSLGGLYVQMFARKYPRDVSGVVLLDSSSADAPSELKTRARLEPGTAAYFEEEGIAESNKQVKGAGPFPDVPLGVIAATNHGPYFKDWEATLMRLQQELAMLSPQGRLVVAEGSGHDIQLDRPNIVIEAVMRIVAAQGPK